MTYGFQYNVKKMDSGALAITFPAFPEIVSVIDPGDDIADEAQLTLIDAINSRLEFGCAVPEAEEISEGGLLYAWIAPHALSMPQSDEEKLVFSFEEAISQNVLEELVNDTLPKLPIQIGKNSLSGLIMSVIEKCQDIMEKLKSYGGSLEHVKVRIEIIQSGSGVYATTEIKAAPKDFALIVIEGGGKGGHVLPSPDAPTPRVRWCVGDTEADIKFTSPKAA